MCSGHIVVLLHYHIFPRISIPIFFFLEIRGNKWVEGKKRKMDFFCKFERMHLNNIDDFHSTSLVIKRIGRITVSHYSY